MIKSFLENKINETTISLQDMINEKNSPNIGVVPYGKWPSFNLSKMPLRDLEWPLGKPTTYNSGYVGDLTQDDHILTYPRKAVFLHPRFKVKAKVSVMIVEPDIVHGKYLVWSKYLNWRFFRILTKNNTLLKSINNSVFHYFGSTFLQDPSIVVNKKSKLASLIASSKRDLPGHKLRHKTVDFIRENHLDIDIIGRGYQPFKNKEDGLSPYYFSVVIENIQEPDYLSEKLIDACLCETIPIYWGAPNIEKYLDIRGIIICNSAEEINIAINSLNKESYQDKLKWIQKNKITALYHADYIKRATLIIQNNIKEKKSSL